MAMTPGSTSDWLVSDTIGALSGSIEGHAHRASSGSSSEAPSAAPGFLDFRAALAAFASAWECGETRAVDSFVRRLDPRDSHGAVELIYREFCLVEAAGCKPDPADYAARFPGHKAALERLLSLHGECTASLLSRWVGCAPAQPELPDPGDAIGPFVLRRELGRGSFARVYLAEQTNLENRLVVLKVSTRITREPWLLARVRHAHIVEIVSHAAVDDGALHLICMPFWGGATLAAVLGAPRARGTRPSTGRDLLAALDAVAAPEFPTVHPAEPAREILAGLSYSQSLAWVGARLAEALDHAFGRAVAHGDIKPSNILLSADGSPMLLDFNLARDGAPTGPTPGAADLGGTLAYMAPERLSALTADDELAFPWGSSLSTSAVVSPANRSQASPEEQRSDEAELSPHVQTDPTDRTDERGPSSADFAPHLADIYALGMVLLEAVTGAPPAQPAVDSASRGSRTGALLAVASEYAATRGSSAAAVIRAAETASRRPVASGLREILERCLSPDPGQRYRRSWELAEDLDRWRTGRPLAFTAEPFWGLTVPRWLRRRRRALITAVFSVAVAALTATLSMIRADQALQAIALSKLARHIDDPEAYRFQRSIEDWLGDPRQDLVSFQPPHSNDGQTVESLLRALNDYGVLGPDDWRERPDVRLLPQADRDDLELWLSEQAYRYCRVLENRPSSPADWRRALDIIDRVSASRSIDAFVTLARRLSAKIDAGGPTEAATTGRAAAQRAAPAWLDAYLLGVAAECDVGAPAAHQKILYSSSDELPHRGPTLTSDPLTKVRRKAALRALEYYRELLVHRPDSYWGHYRVAAISYTLGQFAETASHLEKCLDRRPDNAALRGQRAACLAWLEKFPEALEECNRALGGAPDLAELFRTRAFIRAASGQSGGLSDDIQHFEVLSHRLPRAFWGDETPAGGPVFAQMFRPVVPNSADSLVRRPGGNRAAESASPDHDFEIEPDELTTRAVLAQTLIRAGEPELALVELGKILMLDQDHFAARMIRAQVSIALRRFDDAENDLDVILDHPGLSAYFRADPTFILRFHDATRALFEHGKAAQAEALARRALDRTAGDAGLFTSRLPRALLEIDARRFDSAQSDIDAVLGDPALNALLRKNPALFTQLHELTHSFLRQERLDQARSVARRVLDRALEIKRRYADAHYTLARAYAACGATDPASVVEAADQLFHASAANPEYMQKYDRDAFFDGLRAQLAPMLAQMPEIHRLPDPTAEYRRRFSSFAAKAP
jgi:eukaryotic-like serine/threonine-protein kinase